MATYAENAARRERDDRRRKQDARDAIVQRGLDTAAQDLHHKWERGHFAVVGEGSASSIDNYLRGYDTIDWRA